MYLKKVLENILHITKNHILQKPYKIALSFLILLAGFSFITSTGNSFPLFVYSVFFTLFLLLANYWKGPLLFKYIFSVIAIFFLFIGMQFYDINFFDMQKIVYFIPLVYSSLLPDIISPNILGIFLAQLFSTYFGKEDYNNVIVPIIVIPYISVAFSIVFYLLRKLTTERNKYKELSVTDSLTGLLTLKNFVEKAQKISDNIPEYSLLLIDLDHFKQINDTYGHLIGNKVLIEFSDLLKKEMMDTNCIIGRLGGDEFVVFLYDLPQSQVEKKVQQLYLSFSNKVFDADSAHPPFKMDFTIGTAYSNIHRKLTIQELLNQADSNMYYNKYGEYKLSPNSELNESKLSSRAKQLLRALEEKDMYTYIHSKYTAQYAAELAAALGLPEKKVTDIYLCGLIHDIGKLYIPNDILRKPGKLTLEEYTVIREHVTDGLNILKNIKLSDVMLNGVKYHHEKYDGSGYPNKIIGSETPIEGRIIQIADAFSAMTIKRIYRENLSLDNALQELRKHSGSQFDPELVTIFIELFKEKNTVL